MIAGWGRRGATHPLPAAVTLVGVTASYVLWVLGHPYLAVIVALIGSAVSINHYLIARHGGGVEPYWLIFFPLLLGLSLFALQRDLFAASAAEYVAAIVLALASSSPSMVEAIVRDAMGSGEGVIAVTGAASLAALAYLYVSGSDASPAGFWVMAGPLIEYYVARRVFAEAGGGAGPGYAALSGAYAAAASLMFVPQPYLGAYAVLVNYVKISLRGRWAHVSVLADYVIRAGIVVVLNLGRLRLPSTALAG